MMAKEKLDSLLLRARDSFDVECISPLPCSLPSLTPPPVIFYFF